MNKTNKNSKPNYGNWVPKKMFYILACVVLLAMLLAVFIPITWLKILFSILVILFFTFFCYFFKAYRAFSYNGGGLAEKIHEMMLSYLQWDGNGEILDIGCGSGALAIKLSKRYTNAKITGLWAYVK
jgi:hypothetical protein